MSWLPSDASTIQWALDADQGSGDPYEPSPVDGKAVLRSLESYGDYRRPRGQRCYLFDGVNDHIPIPTWVGFPAPLTVTAWIKTSAVNNRTIVRAYPNASPSSGWALNSQNGTGVLQFYDGSVWRQGTVNVCDGVWHHVAMSCDGSTVQQMYIDAAPDTLTATSRPLGTNNICVLGGSETGTTIWLGQLRQVRIYNAALTADQIAFLFDGSGTDPGLANLAGAWYCNEEDGTSSYDSSGNGNHGTITNATLVTFHATDTGVTSNPANDVGFTDNAGVIVPRDESSPTLDVLGGALQYSGKTPYPQIVEAPVGTFDGVDDHILAPHLTGTETVSSSVGTSTPSISAGRMDFTAGTCSHLVLDDGSNFPICEGAGTTIHNVDGTGNHGTLTNASLVSFWADRNDEGRDHAVEYGGRIGASSEFVPGLLDGSAAADGNPITLLAGHHGNPYSRLVRDQWAAPALAPLAIPAESAPGELERLIAPEQTKFRSEQNPTELADGTAFPDGDNRLFVTALTLSGADLTSALDYIAKDWPHTNISTGMGR